MVPKLDAGNIAEMKDGTIRVGPENNVSEFVGRYQAPLGANCIRELLTCGDRFATDLPGVSLELVRWYAEDSRVAH